MVILVVDDDADIRRLWGIFLTRLGHVTVAAVDAAEALQRLRGEPFDLVLLDLHLPFASGAHLVLTLREDPELARIPILLASSDPDLPTIARDLDIRVWLVKPFNADELEEAIRRAVLPR
jgi:two-component system chemotaxis response regulator CheY